MTNLEMSPFPAGDNVKFGFPMAATTTLLGWSLLEYADAYRASGQLGEMFDCIRWPLEWLLKCHTGENELYVQVNLKKKVLTINIVLILILVVRIIS